MTAPMSAEEVRAFIESAPWKQVRTDIGYGPNNAAAQPHAYVIRDWPEIDDDAFARFAGTIRERGYLARYSPPYAPERVMVCTYLVVGEHYYWYIASQRSLNRALVAHRQHTPLEEPDSAPDQLRLID